MACVCLCETLFAIVHKNGNFYIYMLYLEELVCHIYILNTNFRY